MGRQRFELWTDRLKAECSTAELTTRLCYSTQLYNLASLFEKRNPKFQISYKTFSSSGDRPIWRSCDENRDLPCHFRSSSLEYCLSITII